MSRIIRKHSTKRLTKDGIKGIFGLLLLCVIVKILESNFNLDKETASITGIVATVVIMGLYSLIKTLVRRNNSYDRRMRRERARKELVKSKERNEQIKRIKSSSIEDISPYDYEFKVAEHLKAKGFTNVNTTPKSGDYGADVLAEKDGKRFCIQCKMYNSKNLVGVKAIQEIYTAKSYYKCDYALVFTTSDFTEQARKLAEQLNVKLYIYK